MVTSAGYKSSYAYEKLIQYVCEEVVKPEETMVLGNTWRIKIGRVSS